MHFGCRTYIPIFEFTPSYLQNSINFDSAILSCRRCTYKRIPALAVEQNNCAVLFYTGRYYLALNTAFFLPIYECQHQEQRLYCSIPSLLPKPSGPAPASILNNRNLYWPYLCNYRNMYRVTSSIHRA